MAGTLGRRPDGTALAGRYRCAMRGGRFVVIIIAVAAIAVAAVLALSSGGDKGGGGGGQNTSGTKAAANAIHVSFLYSPEKEALIAPLVRQFNAGDHQSGGKPVFVDAAVVASGDAATKIARGKLKPVAWSPASSLWGRLLNFQSDSGWVPQDNPSLVRTPLVIAMWEPLARALGYPKQNVGFKQILALALDKKGWADYGKPQFGQFKLGHTNPDFSTSGLDAVAAEYYAATGKREGLTVADVNQPKVRAGDQGHRALDRPLRRHHPVLRCAAGAVRARLRERGGDGGGDADRLQQGQHGERSSSPCTRARDVLLRRPATSCSTRRG